MTRVGFFDPYLSILGGGEKYLLSILEEAVRGGAQVDLFSPARPDPRDWERLNVHVGADAFRWRQAGMLGVTPRTRGLDLFVALSNAIPPLSLARRSSVIVQYPSVALREPRVRAADRRLRLRSYDQVLCYSDFVAGALRERLEIADPVVLHPPVDVDGAAQGPKGPSVIAVGRFFPSASGNNKKHDVMIDAFRALTESGGAQGWTLHLAGGCHDDPGSQAHLAQLRTRAEGLAVAFHPNVDPAALDRLYGESSLFWHAAGHGESDPERWEHFGITTAEAMAHGCVPLVPALGGQLEIVTDGVDGRLWRSTGELVAQTAGLIADPQALRGLAAGVRASAERFGAEHFRARVRSTVLALAAA